MDIEQLNKGIEIKKEINFLKKEIKALPSTTHKRHMFNFGKAKLERNYNDLYVVKIYTSSHEVIELNKQDIDMLIEVRKNKIRVLEEELENL